MKHSFSQFKAAREVGSLEGIFCYQTDGPITRGGRGEGGSLEGIFCYQTDGPITGGGRGGGSFGRDFLLPD